ncbi:MAG TPA: hypothetical protein VGY56_05460 [Verrucomicrobiae bacterium]|nr:hypothetical protein [Verrucomicrobiae bacterium]
MILKLRFCSFFRDVIFSSAVGIILLAASEATADGPPAMATSRAVKSGLILAFTERFNAPVGGDLGVGWTRAAHYGLVNEQISHHRLYFEIPSGHDIPWGSATLDLTNSYILGHGLRPGDYFEVTLRRQSQEGSLGVELFDSDQLRVGSDLVRGASALMAWNGITWVPIAFDKKSAPLEFDWNARHTIGVRFDSADGHRANFSYYLDGRYVGSWPVNRPETLLDKIGVYTQSKTANAKFEFHDLKVYTAGRL